VLVIPLRIYHEDCLAAYGTERLCNSSDAFIYVAMTRPMVRRLARV
jgi:hypothetical protein